MAPGPIRRRRSKLLLDASPYAPIVALSPDLIIPQEYASTSADGQILYEDSGATTPVDAVGEPIGGVEFGGVQTAEQTTDADRPVWGGEDVGGQFQDGTHLNFDFTKAAGDGLTISMLFRVTANLGGIEYLYNLERNDKNFWSRVQGSSQVRLRTAEDGGTNEQRAISLSSGDFSDWTAYSFALQESGGTQTYDAKLNDQGVNTWSYASTGSTFSSGSLHGVGALADGLSGGDSVAFDIPIAVIWRRRLSSSELTDVHDILLGGLCSTALLKGEGVSRPV